MNKGHVYCIVVEKTSENNVVSVDVCRSHGGEWVGRRVCTTYTSKCMCMSVCVCY